MGPLAGRAALFFLPLFFALVGIEIKLSLMSLEFESKLDHFERRSSSIEVLFAGNSQALFDVYPDAAGVKGYNIANAWQTPVLDVQLIEYWRPRLPQLKSIVLCISHFSWGTSIGGGDRAARNVLYRRYLGLWGDWRYFWEGLDPRSMSFMWLWGAENLRRLVGLGFPYRVEGAIRPDGGWQSWAVPKEVSPKSAEARVAIHLEDYTDRMRERHEILLVEFIRRWQRTGLKVAIVIPPTWRTYREALPAFVVHRAVESRNRVLSQIPEPVPVIDDYEAVGFSRDDYFDNDHLKSDSAALWTRSVVARLRAMGTL